MKRFNFPFDYEPKVDIKNTILYSSYLRQLIFEYFNNKYHTINIDPALLVTNKYSAGSHINGDRLFNFDNKATNSVSGFNNNQENYLMLSSLILKNQNLISYCPFIRRDAKQTNTESVLFWNINADLAMPADTLNIEYFCNFAKNLFNDIFNLTRRDQLKNIYSPLLKKTKTKSFSVISLQKLENEYPSLNIKEALTHYVSKHRFTIVTNNYSKTIGNQWLEIPVLTAHDMKICCGLYVYDEVNEKPINLINIVKRPDGLTSHSQLNDLNPIELSNNLYSKSVFDANRPTNMAVSINFTNLIFYLLDKIHLAEVVASIWPDEFIEFIRTAKIEIF